MAYNQKTWQDRISEYPTRRLLTDVSDSTSQTVTVSRAEGTISQEGDAFNATTMNDLEQRIADAFGDCTFELGADGKPYVVYTVDGTEVKKELGSIDLSSPLATQAQVLNGYSFGTMVDGELVSRTGTMLNRGAVRYTITPTEQSRLITIPQGYHNGGGAVTVSGVSLSGDASESEVLNGKTYYSNSLTKRTGTMTNRDSVTNPISTDGRYVRIPTGAYITTTSTGYPHIDLNNLLQSKTVTPSSSAQTITADAGSILEQVTVAKIPTVTKSISGKTIYFQQTAEFNAGTLQVSPMYPIRPTSMRIVSGQTNQSTDARTWTPVLEGLRDGTSTWDILATGSSYTIAASGGYQALNWTFTPSIPSNYTGYYSMFRMNFIDRNRMDRNSYAVIAGTIAI